MSGKVISLCGVFGKVFGSGLRPSFFLFLPGLPVFSTKLITAQRALSCLVCLFFRPRAHARARASPASPSLARSLFLPLRLPVSLFSAADSPPDDLTVPPVVFFSRSFVSSPLLPPLRRSRSLALATIFYRMACLTAATAGLSPSACLPRRGACSVSVVVASRWRGWARSR